MRGEYIDSGEGVPGLVDWSVEMILGLGAAEGAGRFIPVVSMVGGFDFQLSPK